MAEKHGVETKKLSLQELRKKARRAGLPVSGGRETVERRSVEHEPRRETSLRKPPTLPKRVTRDMMRPYIPKLSKAQREAVSKFSVVLDKPAKALRKYEVSDYLALYLHRDVQTRKQVGAIAKKIGLDAEKIERYLALEDEGLARMNFANTLRKILTDKAEDEGID